MKHFYFVTEVLKHSKKHGCSDIRCRIYKLEVILMYNKCLNWWKSSKKTLKQ